MTTDNTVNSKAKKSLDWVNVLHFYQSPFQHIDIVKKKTAECYIPVSRLLLERPGEKAIVNIHGCLLDTIYKKIPEGRELISNLRLLLSRGQIELTGTGKYHPVFPLISEDEVRRQLTLQEEALYFYFEIQKTPEILYLPELAYLPEQMHIFKEKGYRWVIVDDISLKKEVSTAVPGNYTFTEKWSGINLLVRSRNISQALENSLLKKYHIKTSSEFIDRGLKENSCNDFIVTVTSADVYGRKNHLHTLKSICDDNSIKSFSLKDISFFYKSSEVETVPASSSTTDEHISQNIYFPLWYHPRNRIHLNLWLLLDITAEEIRINGSEYHNAVMDRLLNSSLFSWSSYTPLWNKAMVEKFSDYMVYLLEKTKSSSDEILHTAHFMRKKINDEVFILERSGLLKKFQEHYF
jgi:hypothetical protein